jgi:hypothetical protein
MRYAVWVTALVVLAAACGGGAEPRPSVMPSRTSPSETPVVSPPASLSLEPVGLPAGTPASYAEGVEAADLPSDALVPEGTAPSELWPIVAPDGTQFALVAFAEPGDDPFRRARGLIVWRRFEDAPPWRPVFGISDAADAGVVEIRATIGDATNDGSPDAVTFEDTGGSGACGVWRVLDLVANAQVFERQTCDTTIDLSSDPVGLTVREAVFEEGDAHCCPSATRTSVLVLRGSDWKVYSTIVQPS